MASLNTRSANAGYLLSLPYLFMLAAFGVGPTVYAVYLSGVDLDGAFVGLTNYIDAFRDFRFGPALAHVILFMALWIPFMLVMVLIISFVLQARPGRFAGAMRMVYYLPGAFTGSASVLLWFFIVDPRIGPFRAGLSLFGWDFVNDVVTPGRLPLIFALMAFTTGAGGWIVIMYGALNSLGSEVLEAADIDGANILQRIWYIEIPLMMKYVVYMLILCFAAGLQIFAEPYIMGTRLGVASPTWSLNQLALTVGISEGKVGQSAAISLCMLAVGLAAALVIVFRTDFFDTKGAAR
jgi:multiple sugar transport system permease protein